MEKLIIVRAGCTLTEKQYFRLVSADSEARVVARYNQDGINYYFCASEVISILRRKAIRIEIIFTIYANKLDAVNYDTTRFMW
ncbi:MAG: hypothetical protein WCR68_02170 [Candidatus Dojkabacteria bacterium]|jgi:hypothetical protein